MSNADCWAPKKRDLGWMESPRSAKALAVERETRDATRSCRQVKHSFGCESE